MDGDFTQKYFEVLRFKRNTIPLLVLRATRDPQHQTGEPHFSDRISGVQIVYFIAHISHLRFIQYYVFLYLFCICLNYVTILRMK